MKPRNLIALALLSTSVLGGNVRATSSTWIATGNGSWTTTGNWQGGTVPGGTGSGNSDTATFNTSTGGTVTLSTRNLGTIDLTGNVGSFTFSESGGTGLAMTSGGSIGLDQNTTSSGQTETFNTPITAAGSFAINNNATTSDVINITSSSSITNSKSSGTDIITFGGTNTGANTISAVISNGAAATTQIGKSGPGTWVLAGANTYTGATAVSGGILTISGSTASGSAVLVTGGTLNVTGKVGGTISVSSGATLSGSGNGTTTGVIGALTLAGGSTINTQDGVIGTLGGSTLTLNTGGGNATLSLDVGATSDKIDLSGGALLNNVFTVNVDTLSGATAGTAYTFISATGGLTLGDFAVGTLDGTLSGDTFSLSGGGSSVVLTINAAGSTSYFFTGATSNDITLAGNYNTTATGNTAQTTALSSTSNVFLGATSPSPSHLPPTLGSNNLTINSLTFTATGAGTSLNGTGTLTLDSSSTALTDIAGGTTTETVNAPVALGASQIWAVTNSGNTLADTGGISGAYGLTLTGPGSFSFTSGSTYSGGTTVSNGTKLSISNGSGSATGTGPLTVQRGATFGGTGISNSTRFDIGSGGTGTALVQVGNGIDATSTLTVTGTTSSGTPNTISNAKLTFNLNTANTNSNKLIVNGSTIAFTNTTLTLNLQGANVISADTIYTLFEGTSNSQYTGFSTFTNSSDQTEIITTSSGLNFTFGTSAANDYYANSYLFLDNGDIDVEVVPEPGTWALMLGGLALLVFWQRRRGRAA